MKRRLLALVHDHLVPPDDTTGIDILEADWKMEYDVIETLREVGHDVRVLGINDDLMPIRRAAEEFRPQIVLNLMEAFAGVTTFDQNVVSYLELLRIPYTGCNPRGLTLARDKSIARKLLAYHRIPSPDFAVVPVGRAPVVPRRLGNANDAGDRLVVGGDFNDLSRPRTGKDARQVRLQIPYRNSHGSP